MDGTHKARKRFGQNFLVDQSVIENIIGNLQIGPDDHLVEIGPGKGAITESLLTSSGQLDVIELDRDLVVLLEKKFQAADCLRIISADALKYDYKSLCAVNEKIRIIGNLPYNISTPLLFYLFNCSEIIKDMHFMLQKELVDRICASPGSKKYGRLSVMTQYYCSAENLFEVPPESFEPIPKVFSAVIKLTPHLEPPVTIKSKAMFNKIVTQAFSQRRKTLRNSLKLFVSEQQIKALSIDPGLRAESISLQEFAQLSNVLPE